MNSSSSMSNVTATAAANNSSANLGPQPNATAPASAPVKATSDDSTEMTLLSFGPLSSCISIPDLSGSPLPSTANLSSASQQQNVQAWLMALPTSRSCSTFSWTLQPDYTEHLTAVANFQTQLGQLFPPTSSSLGAKTVLEKQPGGPAGVVNASSTSSIPAVPMSTASFNASSLFGGNSSSAAVSTSNSDGVTLPTGLPLWIGVSIAIATLVNILALVLHIFSDLETLFPSLANKLRQSPNEEVLPSHTSPSNNSSATLVDEKQATQADAGGDEKVMDPPEYTAPETRQEPASMPALIRYSRKAKRLVVPLLLASSLACIGVAVVLNSKFSQGVVTSFPATTAVPIVAVPSSSSVPYSALTSSAPSSTALNATRSQSVSTPSMTSSASLTTARERKTESELDPETTSSASVESEPRSSGLSGSATMTRLVKRQGGFFPTIVASPASPSLTPTATASIPANVISTVAPARPTSTSEPSMSNASLFPPVSSASIATSTLSSISTSPTTTTTTASAAASPTTTTTTASAAAVVPTGPDPSSSQGGYFEVTRSSSMHRLWWLVLLDALLWFVQRRRTRSQTSLDAARQTVLKQLHLKSTPH